MVDASGHARRWGAYIAAGLAAAALWVEKKLRGDERTDDGKTANDAPKNPVAPPHKNSIPREHEEAADKDKPSDSPKSRIPIWRELNWNERITALLAFASLAIAGLGYWNTSTNKDAITAIRHLADLTAATQTEASELHSQFVESQISASAARGQLGELRESVSAAQTEAGAATSAAQAAKDQLTAMEQGQRAFIYLDHIGVEPSRNKIIRKDGSEQGISIYPVIVNGGDTVSKVVYSYAIVEVTKSPEINAHSEPIKTILGPHQTVRLITRDVTYDAIRDYNAYPSHFYIITIEKYRDIFTDRTNITMTCNIINNSYSVNIYAPIPTATVHRPPPVMNFIPDGITSDVCPTHNCADDECKPYEKELAAYPGPQ